MNSHPKQFKITWLDRGQEPTCPANPAYPEGIDLDLSEGRQPTCKTELPYPARRIGAYLIKCSRCKITVGCTTAGRLDDPRSITIPCRPIPSYN